LAKQDHAGKTPAIQEPADHGSAIAERWNNRALFSLLWPLIVEQVLLVAMGAADTAMVSSVGEFAVSGVNIVDNINNLLIIAFTALCSGGAVVVSQYIGRRDHKNSRLAARQLVYVAVAVSLAVMLVALLFRRPIIRLTYGDVADDVMEAAAVYLLFTSLSYPFLALYASCAALFRATGNSKVPMRISLLANVLSVGGNVVLIFGLGLGVLGAAVSTFGSRIVAAAIASAMLYRNDRSHVSLAGLFKIRIVFSMIKNICNVGIPGAMESSMFMMGRILTQRIFVFFDTPAMAANAITSVINSFAFMPGIAFGIALTVVVGQCIGAGDYAAAQKQTAKIMKLAYAVLFAISAATFVFMDPLVGLFDLSPEAHELALSFLRIHCFSMALGWAMSFILPNALRAAGDARFVMVVAVISMWTVRVSAAYFLVFSMGMGPQGVLVAMAMDFGVRGVSYFLRWTRGKWKGKRVIED